MQAKLIGRVPNMTTGKFYQVEKSREGEFDVYDDVGYMRCIYSTAFELLPETRSLVGVYKESKDKQPITYKDFLASVPKSANASVTMYQDNSIIANVYGFDFECKTEERAEEVYTALITLFKEPV